MNRNLSRSDDVILSIDSGIQNILKKLMFAQIKKFKVDGGAGIIMNASNGKIQAIVSLPDYNNNNINGLSKEQLFNKATKGVYELGHIENLYAAMAIESGI